MRRSSASRTSSPSTMILHDVLERRAGRRDGMRWRAHRIPSCRPSSRRNPRPMVGDVTKLHLLTDPGVHFKLVCFCHNTRRSHLNRTLPPTTMANPACGIQTVDYAVVNEVLARQSLCLVWARRHELAPHDGTAAAPRGRDGPHTAARIRDRGLLLRLQHFRWLARAAPTSAPMASPGGT